MQKSIEKLMPVKIDFLSDLGECGAGKRKQVDIKPCQKPFVRKRKIHEKSSIYFLYIGGGRERERERDSNRKVWEDGKLKNQLKSHQTFPKNQFKSVKN